MNTKKALWALVPVALAGNAAAAVPAAYTTAIGEVITDSTSIGTSTIVLLIGLVGAITLGVIAMNWVRKSRGAAK